jgi:AcrR family transcriptional regulator
MDTGTGIAADAQEHIVAAAANVFATEATRQVTLKRVALEARLPSAEVTERFDSTADLLSAVFASLSDELHAGFPDGEVPRHGGDLDEAQRQLLDAIVMISTRAVLDGFDPAQLRGTFPMLDRMAQQGVDDGHDERTARYRVFETLLLEFALRVFARPLADMCGLDDESDHCLQHEVSRLEMALHGLPPVEPCGQPL